ncbi:MAG: hypothetical protein KAI55_04275 [Candidatus Aenigmarchaeota archaeon]|nr:hypothetical protein [Candidatus Aenigmarchaeota archaeon]
MGMLDTIFDLFFGKTSVDVDASIYKTIFRKLEQNKYTYVDKSHLPYLLTASRGSWKIRHNIIDAIKSKGDYALSDLVEAVGKKKLSRDAIDLLEEIADPNTIPIICRNLKNTDKTGRASLAYLLGELAEKKISGMGEAVNALNEVYTKQFRYKDPTVRKEVEQSLKKISKYLPQYNDSITPNIVEKNNFKNMPIPTVTYNDAKKQERYEIIYRNLWEWDNYTYKKEDISLLLTAHEEEDWIIKDRIKTAIQNAGDSAIKDIITFESEQKKANPQITKDIVNLFISIGKPTISPICKALENPNTRRHNFLAIALVEMANRRTDGIEEAKDTLQNASKYIHDKNLRMGTNEAVEFMQSEGNLDRIENVERLLLDDDGTDSFSEKTEENNDLNLSFENEKEPNKDGVLSRVSNKIKGSSLFKKRNPNIELNLDKEKWSQKPPSVLSPQRIKETENKIIALLEKLKKLDR